MRAALTAIIINADDAVASCCTSYAQVSSSVDVAAPPAVRPLGHDRCSSHLHTFTGSYGSSGRKGEGAKERRGHKRKG